MKKFFTLIAAAAAAMSMSAANFALYFEDEKCTDGATYTSPLMMTDQYEYKGVIYTEWKQDSRIFIHGDVGTNVSVEVTPDAKVQFCAIDGLCVMVEAGETRTKTGALKSAVNDAMIDKLFETEGDENPSDVVEPATVVVTAWDNADPSTKVTVTVVMSNETAGIDNAVAEKEFIKVAPGNILKYNVNKPSTLTIFSITGQIAARYQIANSGSLNVSNLGKGMYIYTDGRNKGKLIVR